MEDVLNYVPRRGVTIASPGPVATLGTTATQIRLKSSSPDSPLRFEKGTVKKQAARLGTMVSDGQVANPISKGNGYTAEIPLRGRLRKQGTRYQALVPEDRDAITNVATNIMNSYTILKNEVNSNFGSLFQDLPDGYKPPPGAMLRGGNFPTMYGSDDPPESSVDFEKYRALITNDMIPFQFSRT